MTEAQAQRLGQLILRARTRRGWSLATLSDHTGIPDVWLNRVERGLYLQPAPERLAKTAEVLRIDPITIDRATHDYLAESLPGVRTYFRSKEKLSPGALDKIEAMLAEIQASHAAPGDETTKPTTVTRRGGTP
jgi:transcriptional regulator with XRE-family HTH domain